MNNSIDLFELESPLDLFKEVQKAIVEYDHEPTSRVLLFLLFSLNHLREWIAGSSHEAMEKKRATGAALLPQEQLYFDIGALEEFRTIKSLCNRSKHHNVKRGGSTSVTRGMTCDSPCTDSLGQVYYRIDGVDSREIFYPVMRKYYEWFVNELPPRQETQETTHPMRDASITSVD
ncbi:hypothetical protein GTZ97_09815 [Aquabacterium fontiphilum]|uniref:hypothetical protein n=1 Tax=Aquabacterium fontiphilum TaxID=450365 RepID=UPI0013774EC8|nr:hypothetical protein [Aquabacterium fontiphilum]NBD20965.1 hypothetical protein [Aquabacterium fontiphilum]